MDPAEYSRMYSLEETYWWFQGRKKIIARILERLPLKTGESLKTLDLGCGTGLMLDHLNSRHWAVGLDFSPLALEFTRRRGADRLVRADVERLPIRSASADLVIALDLAEHVARDGVLLAEAWRALAPGGYLVMTVPAHPFLWSEHDEALYHFRRYTKSGFRSLVEAANFRLLRLTYCIAFTFPPIVCFRLLQRLLRKDAARPKTHLIQLPKWANRLMLATVEMEGRLLDWMDLPFGVTLLAVAVKPPDLSPDSPEKR